MRISDWSSDVCSSDLRDRRVQEGPDPVGVMQPAREPGHGHEHHQHPQPERARRAPVEHPRREHRQRRPQAGLEPGDRRSEEHTSELQSLMRISYAVFCLTKKKSNNKALPLDKAAKLTTTKNTEHKK